MTVRHDVERAVKGVPKRPIIGLAELPDGVAFRCGTCEYFDKETSKCQNPDPLLKGVRVKALTQCCDLYDHPGMKRIIK